MLDVNTLHTGDVVAFSTDSHRLVVTVQNEPEEFGQRNSRTVTIGFGPGRWNRSVSNAGQEMGFYVLERAGE